MKNILKAKLKAFSIVETVVTLAIFGVLLAMLTQVLLLNITVSRKISVRTRMREELSALVGLMQRDLRNADVIFISEGQCGTGIVLQNPNTNVTGCHVALQNEEVFWVYGGTHSSCSVGKICKLNWINQNEVLFETSPVLSVTGMNIDAEIYASTPDSTSADLLITMKAESANPAWDVRNQVRQISVTTRNF